MLTVREVRGLARQLDAVLFARQLGPFVLVQRPTREALEHRADASWATTERALPPVRRAPLEFDDCWVLTLPPLLSRDVFTLGRSPDAELVVDHGSVSKHHAKLTWTGEEVLVQDLKSSNGTQLNGKRVAADPVPLKDGDSLDFGEVQFFYLLVPSFRRRLGLR